jgi:hypothetical protein
MASDFAAQQAWAMPSGIQHQSSTAPAPQQELIHNVQQGMNQMSFTDETHRPAPPHIPSRATNIISTVGDEEFEGRSSLAIQS